MADSLPSHWLLYVSLTSYPKNSSPIEIDAFLVTDDRILLLELKDWNGDLTASGGRWLVGGRPRGRSPVALLAEKARKVKGIVAQRIPALSKVYVDFRVVLTGSSTAAKLPEDDQRHTWSLAEAATLGDDRARALLLGRDKLVAVAPSTLEREFDRVLDNPSLFRASQMNWDGYEISESDLFVHPRGLWSEHGVQQVRDPRIKALLRRWALDRLPHQLNSPETRRIVAEREARVVGLLREAGSRLIADAEILQSGVAPPDEILTDHHEILALPPNWSTFRRYVAKNDSTFEPEQRLDLLASLASIVAELHSQGIAHRDLAPSCIWMTSPTRIALTGFMSAQMPNDESVGDWLGLLRGYSASLPEDGDKSLAGTAFERDVYQLAAIARELFARAGAAADFVMPPGLDALLGKAGASNPADRFTNAIEFADALGAIVSPPEPAVDQSRLDAYQVSSVPFVAWPANGEVTQSERCTAYPAGSGGEALFVKIWVAIRRGQSASLDLAMLAMLDAVTRLRLKPAAGLPLYVAAGLSPVGPFIVCRRVEGVPLADLKIDDPADAAAIVEQIAQAVETLHGLGCTHGDLSPANILVAGEARARTVTLIDLFDLAPPGVDAMRNIAFLPEGWERLTGEQIDRFAVVKIARDLVERLGPDPLPALKRATAEDLLRPAVETLGPLVTAAQQDRAALEAPPVQAFRIRAAGLPGGSLKADDGKLYVKVRRFSDGRTEYRIAGLDSELLLRMQGAYVELARLAPLDFQGLAGSRRGTPLAFTLETADGIIDDVADLVAFLGEHLPEDVAVEKAGSPGARPNGFPVADLWRTLIDLEEQFVPSATIGEKLAETAEGAIFEYETDRPFDFDSESDVEVRSRDGGRGRTIGKLDLRDLSESTLAIRRMTRPPAPGETVSLVDRRAQASIDRRRRGLDRILGGESEIPDLIDYFEPSQDKRPTSYDLVPTEEELDAYSLNMGQRTAFRSILASGPVGLLQGPPGTGKTRFIGAIVHWLVTRAGASKILVASQSHEAVNGAAEELIKLFGSRGDKLELLRVGAKGLTSRLRPYHPSTLREHYQRRFDVGMKTRVTAAGAALGIGRALLYDLVDLDRSLGRIGRRIHLLDEAMAAPDVTPEETRRLRDRLRSASAAFVQAAGPWIGAEPDPDQLDIFAIIEQAHAAVAERYPKASPADLTAARRLLALSLEWNDTLSVGHRNFEEFLAKTRTVIAGTCVGLGQSRIRLESGSFDWVVVDEAARCTAGELAVPLQLGRRVLLVGDHLQLPPMIDRTMVKAATEELPGVTKRDVTRSDFERAFTSSYGEQAGCVLEEQYRMVEPICTLVSKTFYAAKGVKLVTSKDRADDLRFDRELPAILQRPINWIDTRGARAAEEKRPQSEHSTWNEAEVEATMRLLALIARQTEFAAALAADEEQTIGVICMYKKQKREIERRFAQQPFDAAFRRTVKIDTVDSYQGKENAVVILSLVRANNAFDAGHVRSSNRCNVAMSRARERLYIVGHTAMWRDHRCRSPMRSVLREIEGNKTGAAAVVRLEDIR
ncbi:AAA domain-containing protein [Sphingopyxis granuli]|uniref:AAA domain-containing protein n=1 Tax=Sphingopyxis granuli TaxID=267128 RepID=UPI00301C4060